MPSKLDLGVLFRSTQEQLQGYVLDLARISPMDDRQFKQFERSVKRYFRETIDSQLSALKEYNESTKGNNFEISDRPPFIGVVSNLKVNED